MCQSPDGNNLSQSTWLYNARNLPIGEIANGQNIACMTYDSMDNLIEYRRINRDNVQITSITYYKNDVEQNAKNQGLIVPPMILEPEFKSAQKYYLKSFAHYPGSQRKLKRFFEEQARHHKFKQEGIVSVTFDVGADGSISNPKISRSVSKETDDVAIQLINSMPPWIPMKKSDGKPTKSTVTLGINFKLNN